jgi:hypothetical protein
MGLFQRAVERITTRRKLHDDRTDNINAGRDSRLPGRRSRPRTHKSRLVSSVWSKQRLLNDRGSSEALPASFAWLSNPNHRFDDRLHYRRADSVTDHHDFVAPTAVLEVVAIRETHRTGQFLHLEHSQHGFVSFPSYQTETVKRRQCSQRAIEALPSPQAAFVRSIINDKEGYPPAKSGNCPISAL